MAFLYIVVSIAKEELKENEIYVKYE